MGDIRMNRANIHGGETAPAVTNHADAALIEGDFRFQRLDAGIQIVQTLGESAGVLSAGFHAAGMVVGKDQIARPCKTLDFTHIGTVTVAHTWIKHHKTSGDGIVVMVKITA